MATVTQLQPRDREEPRRRVGHPLERLRSYIRFYVTAEGLALLGLYLALWFWIGLALDYGFFRLFSVDWVQVLPWGLRAGLLIVLGAGVLALVATKMLVRLFREFHEDALALVLERRFPRELGDRLITAVELADPRLAERYGYSQAMVDRTIEDAAERVERLPVGDVFDWPRLRHTAIWLGVLTLGLYLLVGTGYWLWTRAGAGDYIQRFSGVAGIWFERNILLQDTIWPRRAYLQLVNFPPSGDLRVGRNAPAPALRVRALKWVVADPRAPEGWRGLRWNDVPALLEGSKPALDLLPADWRERSVDQIELDLDKPDTRARLDADTVAALRDIFARLQEQANSPRMMRRLRQLTVPQEVTVYYRGDTIRSEQTLKRQADHEYSGVLSDLRESVQFTANGEDYYTPYKKITLVPPPTLIELLRDEDQPAYLYHRPPQGGKPEDLRGKKQQFRDVPVSLSGNTSHIDVPAGTHLLIRGKTDKALRSPEGVRMRPREGGGSIGGKVQQTDPYSFEVRFDNVTATLDFSFELVDTDDVVGARAVLIKPVEDMPPEVDVQVEVIPKTNAGFLITPSAMIPFSGKVRDDHGLDSVEYVYVLVSTDSQALAALRPIMSAFQFVPRGLGADVAAPAYLAWASRASRIAAEEASNPPERTPLSSFVKRQRERSGDDETPEALAQNLERKPEQILLRDHTLDPDEEFFDVEKLNLKVSDDRQTQPHHRLRLWVVATDNNVETGPGIGQSKEKFNFLIVSENELLVEIAKEEESLHVKLEDTVNKLKDARTKLERVIQELPLLKPEEFSPMARRAEELIDVLVKSWDVSREVYLDYRKILKQLRVNRVNPKIIEKVEHTICEPLDGAINQEFVRADESLRVFQKLLEDKKPDMPAAALSREQMDKLIDQLMRVLDAMGDITTINKLIEQLTRLAKEEEDAYKQFKELHSRLQDKLLDSALSKPEEKKP